MAIMEKVYQKLAGIGANSPTPAQQREPTAVPGLEEGGLNPEVESGILTKPEGFRSIGLKDIEYATEMLNDYQAAKQLFQQRVIEEEQWYKQLHWQVINSQTPRQDGEAKPPEPEPTSAWLVNTVLNKHADMMDFYPEPIVLPREQSDEQAAKELSSVIPVVLEHNNYEDTYSNCAWDKVKHGVSIKSVIWNKDQENGLGEIDIRRISLLKIFWEPGITDIQQSRNVFITELADIADLKTMYPEFRDKFGFNNVVQIPQYMYTDSVEAKNKAIVVDWYYKRKMPGGRTILHYAKFCGNVLLYASENDTRYRDSGFYTHGKYPFVFDVMYPDEDTPTGFGIIALCRDPQLYIDKLEANILENSLVNTKCRYVIHKSVGINRQQLLDTHETLVDFTGSKLDDSNFRILTGTPLSPTYVEILERKINEMKETTGNRDFNTGGTTGGVTAASAIAALQEAGNKLTRDMNGSSWRAESRVTWFIIELMRQKYNDFRVFRITGDRPDQYSFIEFSNEQIKDQVTGVNPETGVETFRRPIFDVKITAQRKNPFNKMVQNEMAKELYSMGFFDPNNAQAALGALDMMEFEGKDKVKTYIMNGQQMLDVINQQAAMISQMSAQMGLPMGQPTPSPKPMGMM